MKSIAEQITQLKGEIRRLENKYSRAENSVHLLAVSKTKPLSDIKEAIACGQRDFGENYLQETLGKIHELSGNAAIWHFIGPVQSNKTRAIAEHFQWLHSLDRLKIAQRLNQARPETKPPLNVCIQVNISQETSKSGINESAIFELAKNIRNLPNLKLRGLMALPKPADTLEEQREQCMRLKLLFDELNNQGYALDTLSMGTSSDMEAAIAEGSTMLRIGTAIFGARN